MISVEEWDKISDIINDGKWTTDLYITIGKYFYENYVNPIIKLSDKDYKLIGSQIVYELE
jgi:hypothetical protein